ncbi:hypothetical protein JCM6882_001680 [Rhodosporidiobolus microsporus]
MLYSSIAASPPPPHPALVPLSLSSSSPIPRPHALDPASVGAPVKHAHFQAHGEQGADEGPGSPTEQAKRMWRGKGRGGRRAMSRSEGQENDGGGGSGTASKESKQSRRATFSKVVSSDRTTLVGLGQPHSTGKIGTPPRTGSYIPPHQRRSSLSTSTPLQTQVPFRNPLSAFDRSACPEPEDSFYTHVSSLSFSPGQPGYDTTPFSTPASSRYGSPATALSGFAGPKPSPLSFGSPGQSTAFQATPASPTTLISRAPYVDPSRFAHPLSIPEEGGEVDFTLAPVEALNWEEEAALADFDDDDGGEEGEGAGDEHVEVRVRMGVRRRSSAFVNLPGLPEDAVPDDACSGCGAEKNAAFIELVPCHHLLCHVCTNALINGAAHKPPRPTDCFACTNFVESFVPAFPSSTSIAGSGGVGLVLALKEVLFTEKTAEGIRTRRRSIASSSTAASDKEHETGSVKLSRTRRRRSSVVAAAIAATLLAAHTGEGQQQPMMGRSRSSTIDSFKSLSSLPSEVVEEESLGGAFVPLDDGKASTLTRPPSNLLTTAKLAHFDASSVPFASEWPVVRLDNVPWEITAAEIEEWAGERNLASDLDEFEEKGKKRVTLAVHILCNRADGRTLNQAFLECSSASAARALVRSKDGSKLRGRPVHVSLTGQGEFLTTLFPTYTPGFSSVEPNPNPRSKWAAPIPLLLQTELTGLLNLCRLETALGPQSAHARKVPERPYFNLVTLLEKMPWSFPAYYNSQAVVRLFNTVCAAIEILGSIKRSVPGWKDVLTVLVDAILHCPVFRPQQKQKAVRIATSIGFDHVGSSSKVRTLAPHHPPAFAHHSPLQQPVTSTPSKPLVRGPAAVDTSSFVPSSLKEKFVGTAPDQALLAAKQADGTFVDDAQLVEVGLPSPRFGGLEEAQTGAAEPTSPTKAGGNTVVQRGHHRRRSSIAAQLNIDKALVESVAAALGIELHPATGAAGAAGH